MAARVPVPHRHSAARPDTIPETTVTPPVLDLFAGPGGWSEGLRMLGLRDIGIEWDAAACATRTAAGHLTVRADAAQLAVEPMADRVQAAVFSPPCQPFSQGGHRLGITDQPLVHQAVHDLAHGRDTRAGLLTQCQDRRSLLAAEPTRYLHAIRPEWTAMEEVPAVLPLWLHYAEILRGWGYSTWCGVLNSADYGLGQARRRAILIASRVRSVTAPPVTHAADPQDDLFGTVLQPWVTMADALGWGYTQRPAPTITGGGTDTGGAEPWSSTSRRAMREAMADPTHWAWRKPAPTVGGTVGHVAGKQASGHLNLSIDEAARLQGFRNGYPWQGNKGQRSLQVGNAVPPLLAAHIVSAATGIPLDLSAERHVPVSVVAA